MNAIDSILDTIGEERGGGPYVERFSGRRAPRLDGREVISYATFKSCVESGVHELAHHYLLHRNLSKDYQLSVQQRCDRMTASQSDRHELHTLAAEMHTVAMLGIRVSLPVIASYASDSMRNKMSAGQTLWRVNNLLRQDGLSGRHEIKAQGEAIYRRIIKEARDYEMDRILRKDEVLKSLNRRVLWSGAWLGHDWSDPLKLKLESLPSDAYMCPVSAVVADCLDLNHTGADLVLLAEHLAQLANVGFPDEPRNALNAIGGLLSAENYLGALALYVDQAEPQFAKQRSMEFVYKHFPEQIRLEIPGRFVLRSV